MNAAVVYLAMAKPGRVRMLVRSLRLLQRNMLDEFPHRVLLLHEGDFDKPLQERLQEICPSLEFREVDISPPPWIDISQQQHWFRIARNGVGYRNMCRLFTLGLYPKLADLDYYMRLDDDSYILSKMPEDPFAVMEDNGYVYGFRSTRPDHAAAVDALVPTLRKHDKLFDRFRQQPWYKHTYYNNFHIAKPSLWTSPPIAAALDYIDRCGGIYTRRWGDAPIQTLMVRAYVRWKQIHHFKSFKYRHARFTWPVGK